MCQLAGSGCERTLRRQHQNLNKENLQLKARSQKLEAGSKGIHHGSSEENYGLRQTADPCRQSHAGSASWPALGQAQVNIMEFCKQFNARTQGKELEGLVVPVVISVHADRSFSFITKTPPAAVLLLKAAGIPKGSGHAEQGKDRQGDRKTGARDRHAEDARSETPPRSRRP